MRSQRTHQIDIFCVRYCGNICPVLSHHLNRCRTDRTRCTIDQDFIPFINGNLFYEIERIVKPFETCCCYFKGYILRNRGKGVEYLICTNNSTIFKYESDFSNAFRY